MNVVFISREGPKVMKQWILKIKMRYLPGGSVVKTLCASHCRGWVRYLVGKLRSHMLCSAVKKKKKVYPTFENKTTTTKKKRKMKGENLNICKIGEHSQGCCVWMFRLYITQHRGIVYIL